MLNTPDEEEQLLLVSNHSPNNQFITIQSTPVTNSQIVHQVIYGDTLQGLSLQYNIPIYQIKLRNHIETDNIYHLKQIYIPNPSSNQNYHQDIEAAKIQQVMLYMCEEDRSSKMARYYLLQSNWQIKEAIKAYKEDLKWERNNNVKSIPVPQAIKNKKYIELELIKKKND